jgi:hypothetical protein
MKSVIGPLFMLPYQPFTRPKKKKLYSYFKKDSRSHKLLLLFCLRLRPSGYCQVHLGGWIKTCTLQNLGETRTGNWYIYPTEYTYWMISLYECSEIATYLGAKFYLCLFYESRQCSAVTLHSMVYSDNTQCVYPCRRNWMSLKPWNLHPLHARSKWIWDWH